MNGGCTIVALIAHTIGRVDKGWPGRVAREQRAALRVGGIGGRQKRIAQGFGLNAQRAMRFAGQRVVICLKADAIQFAHPVRNFGQNAVGHGQAVGRNPANIGLGGQIRAQIAQGGQFHGARGIGRNARIIHPRGQPGLQIGNLLILPREGTNGSLGELSVRNHCLVLQIMRSSVSNRLRAIDMACAEA